MRLFICFFIFALLPVVLGMQGCAQNKLAEYRPFDAPRSYVKPAWEPKHDFLSLPITVEVFIGDQVVVDDKYKMYDYEMAVKDVTMQMPGFQPGSKYSLIAEFFDSSASTSFYSDLDEFKLGCEFRWCACSYSYTVAAHLVLMQGSQIVTSTIVDGSAWRRIGVNNIPKAAECSSLSNLYNSDKRMEFVKLNDQVRNAAFMDFRENIRWHLGFLHDAVGDSLIGNK